MAPIPLSIWFLPEEPEAAEATLIITVEEAEVQAVIEQQLVFPFPLETIM